MKNQDSIYKNKKFFFATMHKKEQWLSPACKKILGADLGTFGQRINTDLLGTFSNEIERKGSQKETILEKCKIGLDLSGLNLGLASEGSFAPHPVVPFISISYETLVFIDQERKLEVFETRMFKNTNYEQKVVGLGEDLDRFLLRVKFPSHALIVRPNIWEDKKIVFKGVQDFTELRRCISSSCENSSDNKSYIETDMRAHMNLTRSLNIRKLGILLFRRLTRFCPICEAPGWGRLRIKRGRPCLVCESPTNRPLKYIIGCSLCKYEEEEPYPGAHVGIEPMYCNVCNP